MVENERLKLTNHIRFNCNYYNVSNVGALFLKFENQIQNSNIHMASSLKLSTQK